MTYLQSCKEPTSRLLRWALKLQQFDFKIVYIKGEENVADCLSRIGLISANKPQCSREGNHELSELEIKQILEQYHKFSGHGSSQTMKFLIKHKFYWKHMFKDVENFVVSCLTCQKAAYPRQNTKNRIIETKSPNELWECDLLGRIQVNQSNNFFIFVAIDHYTKWIETAIIRDKPVDTIKNAIETLIISKHGIPRKLLTDCGLEFTNEKMKELTDKLGIKWITGSPYHHNTTGAIERAIQTLTVKLKKISDFGRKSLKTSLNEATMAVTYHLIGRILFVIRPCGSYNEHENNWVFLPLKCT